MLSTIWLNLLIDTDTLHWTQMADFMIGHLRLVSNSRQDFEVCVRPFETGLNGRRPPETGGHLILLRCGTF